MFHLERIQRAGQIQRDATSTTTAPPMKMTVVLTTSNDDPGPTFKILIRLVNADVEWKEFVQLPTQDSVRFPDSTVYTCPISNAADIGNITEINLLYLNSGIVQGDLVVKRVEISNLDMKRKWRSDELDAKFRPPATNLSFRVVEEKE